MSEHSKTIAITGDTLRDTALLGSEDPSHAIAMLLSAAYSISAVLAPGQAGAKLKRVIDAIAAEHGEGVTLN